MKWLQAIQQKFSPHKYAINAKFLGDTAEFAWTNLGYWDDATSSYPIACQQLAEHLAQAVQLKAQDRVLDLGCGQGASLNYWLEHYHIQHVQAVECQRQCVVKIQKKLTQINAIYCHSFLNLNAIPFQHSFDVVLCIDAAYHSDLNLFLESVKAVLNSNGRLGFHYLMLSDHALTLKQKLTYQWLLKAADVDLKHLMTESNMRQLMQQQGFDSVHIQDISAQVLKGFSAYISNQSANLKHRGIDQFKIQMTAKLCRRLFEEGIVRYIQVNVHKRAVK